MKRTQEQISEISKLPRYWVSVRTTNRPQRQYSKLVSRDKADKMVYGTLDVFGMRVKKLKYEYDFA